MDVFCGCFVLFVVLFAGGVSGIVNVDGDVASSSSSEFVNATEGAVSAKPNNRSFFLSKEDIKGLDNSSIEHDIPSMGKLPSMSNSSDVNANISDRIGMLIPANISELSLNISELSLNVSQSTPAAENLTHQHDLSTADLSVTDEYGCFTVKRDEVERRCYERFEAAVLSTIEENESLLRKSVCCALENYEKCSLQGFQTANCEHDKNTWKESLKAARIFLGALTNISCSEHRGQCNSAIASYAPGGMAIMAVSLLLFLL